jgi:H+-translocating NAD(P) transhydrogenase subunit alpha
MILGLLRESDDTRVALTPATLTKLQIPNGRILVEIGAGARSHFDDAAYTEAGATLATREQVLAEADLLVSIHPLAVSDYRRGVTAVALFQPFLDVEISQSLHNQGVTAFSLDMIPRTTLAQSMDILSSMAGIAGYQAVLLGATHLSRYIPMMVTAAGTVKPSKVLVLGAGVAGLQAIATAKRLGAVVEAFDTRQAAKEEVESLGAKFVEVEGAQDDKGAGGYAVAQSEEFLARQREEVQRAAAKADMVICTAQVRGRKAPVLITEDTVRLMRAGSVIVDLAASTGGNCAVTKDNQTIDYQGVTVIGNSQLANRMPQDASTLFSNNVANFLRLLINKEGELAYDLENEIIKGSKIA